MGYAVINGEVQQFSPTALETGNPRTGKGCPRKYHYRYVMRVPQKQRDSKDTGVEVHAQIDGYLTTGTNILGSIAIRGKHLLPPPGPDLIVERKVDGLLNIDGVPVVGKLDLVHWRGLNYGGSDIEDAYEPAGFVTVATEDQKTSSDFDKYALQSSELIQQIPMIIYGITGQILYHQTTGGYADFTRLSHNYFHTKKNVPGIKRTKRFESDVIRRAYESDVIPVGRLLRDVAKEKDPKLVEPNTRACDAFGGCDYKDICPAGMHGSLTRLFGDMAGTIIRDLESQKSMNPFAAMTQPQAAPAPSANPFAAMGGAPAQPQAPAPAPQGPAPVMVFPDFVTAVQWTKEAGKAVAKGFPTLKGEAADAYHAAMPNAGNIAIPAGTVHNGTDAFGALSPITTQADMIKFAVQFREWLVAQNVPNVPPMNVTNAPAVPTVQGLNGAPPTLAGSAPVQTQPQAPAPAPQGNPFGAAPAQTQPQQPAPQPEAQAPKRGPGRPKKNSAPAPQATAPQTQPQPSLPMGAQPPVFPQGQPQTQPEAQDSDLRLYVDCAHVSEDTQDLRPWIDSLCSHMMERYGNGAPNVLMVADGPLAFGQWRGVLIATLRGAVESGQLPGGAYRLHSRGSVIAECAADALHDMCDLYVRA